MKLIGEFEKIARAMSKKHDLNVVPSVNCLTDGKTINFPFNADYLNPKTKQVLHGWLDHEVGHIIEESRHKRSGEKSPLWHMGIIDSKKLRDVFNSVEDVRMERVLSNLYVGVNENLEISRNDAIEDFKINSKNGTLGFWRVIVCGIILKANGIEFEKNELYEYIFELIDEDIRDIDKAVWVSDSFEIAKKIVEKIEGACDDTGYKEDRDGSKEKDRDPKEEKIGKRKDEGDSGDSDKRSSWEKTKCESSGKDKNELEHLEEEKSVETFEESDKRRKENDRLFDKPKPSSPERVKGYDEIEDSEEGKRSKSCEDSEYHCGRQKDRDDKDENCCEDGSCPKRDKKDIEISDEIKKEILSEPSKSKDFMEDLADRISKESISEAKSSFRYASEPKAKKEDEWKTVKVCKLFERSFLESKSLVSKQINGLKTKLVNLLKTKKNNSVVCDLDNGDLDFDNLYSVKFGNKKIFKQEKGGIELDTAISLLIDESGSMGNGRGSKSDKAKLMTIALSETFEALGIPFEIIGFHNKFCPVTKSVNGFRTQPFLFNVYKSFNESYRKTKFRLGGISGYEDNVDGEAVLEVAKRLFVMHQKRKILFVLSDGEPLCKMDYEILENDLKKTVKAITNAGIEVIGIGANTKSVERFYNKETGSKNIVISDIEQLPIEVYKLMSKTIFKRGK